MEIDRSWGAVVVDNEQKFLLVQHSNGQHWSHPKGHANPGETSVETAVREIREEGKIEVMLVNGFQMRETWNLPNGRRKEVVYYLGRKIDASDETRKLNPGTTMSVSVRQNEGSLPNGKEILGRVWLTYPKALKKITYESGKKVLRGAVEFLRRHGMGG